MTLIVCWLVFPLVLSLLALGCGLLVEHLAGVRLPGALLAPTGFAAVVVVSQLATLSDGTAELAAPAAVGLAVAGLGLALPERLGRPDVAALGAALGVYAVFAAPIVMSGEATFAGYIKLDDTATFLALTDRSLEHGRSLEGLAPSTYETTLAVNLANGYPLGSLLPLGVGAALVGEDPAWVFQPYLAFLAALLALSISQLARGAIPGPVARGGAAFLAAQPALLYGYALWGGIKELAAAAAVALVAALAPPSQALRGGVLRGLPLATAGAAVLGILSLAGGLWLVPAAVAVAFALRRGDAGRREAAGLAGLVAALSLPALLAASDFLRRDNAESFTSGGELGNLVRPLSRLQALGIWPAADFRFEPGARGPAYVLVGLAAAAAVLGVVSAWRSRLWPLVLYAASALAGAGAFVLVGSPWVEAKALAISSPAFLLAGLVGCAAVLARGRRVEAAVAAGGIVLGVLWSNVLAYRGVSLAPRDQLVELERIGERFAGQGPALMTEYEPYGVRHFLRKLDAEGASELRRRPVPLRSGALLAKGAGADLDELSLDAIFVYRTLVLRRSPLASRPPTPYRRVWSGRFYDVWTRLDRPPVAIRDHLPLGTAVSPAAIPSCRDVSRLARLAEGGRLSAPPRADPIVVPLPPTPTPASGAYEIRVPRPGRYGIWIGGSFRPRIEVAVDGEPAGAASRRLNNAGQYEPLGVVFLDAGVHRLTLRADAEAFRPGSEGPPLPHGPIVLADAALAEPLVSIQTSVAAELCTRELDWIEAVAP